MIVKIKTGTININGKKREFTYIDWESFLSKMDEASMTPEANESPVKISVTFVPQNGQESTLRYYSLVEFLLFLNGMKIIKII